MEDEEKGELQRIIEAVDATESQEDRLLSVQLDTSLREAVRAAQNSNQKATVTLTVKVSPGAERRVSFVATVAAKLPRPPVSGITLFADAKGGLHASDPAQKDLFPKPAPIHRKDN